VVHDTQRPVGEQLKGNPAVFFEVLTLLALTKPSIP
jgi:hypothetical protein